MIKLLREDRLATEFKRLAKRTDLISLAAPFWGLGAAAMLGLERRTPLRILCRFDSPACNPRALAELRAIGASIRSHPRLHAKIYLTRDGVIVGSSNPSRYGVTLEGDVVGGTIEANLITDDQDVMRSVNDLFEQLWSDPVTTSVTSRMIKREIERRDALPPSSSPRRLSAKSLLAACREAPELFGSVVVGAYGSGLGPEGRKALQQLQERAVTGDNEIGVADFKNAWGYQFEVGPPEGSWVIDLNCRGKRPRVLGASKVPSPALRLSLKNEEDLTPTVRGTVKVPGAIGSFRLLEKEKEQLVSVADQLLREARFIPLPEVVAIIDNRFHSKRP